MGRRIGSSSPTSLRREPPGRFTRQPPRNAEACPGRSRRLLLVPSRHHLTATSATARRAEAAVASWYPRFGGRSSGTTTCSVVSQGEARCAYFPGARADERERSAALLAWRGRPGGGWPAAWTVAVMRVI